MQTRTKVVLGASLVAALAAGTLGLSAAIAQEGADPKAKPEPKAAPAPIPAPAPAPAEDYDALVKSLGDQDFVARTRAYDSLKAAGGPARKALEEGAKSEDAQIRWSAGRLLRELGGPGAATRRRALLFRDEADRPGPDARDPDARDQDARDQDARDQDARDQDARDPGTGPGPGPGTGSGPGWDLELFDRPDFRQSMEDLRRRLQEMEQEFRSMTRDVGNRAGDLSRELAGRGFRIFNSGNEAGVDRHVIVEKDGERTELMVAADGKVSVKLGHKDADGKPVEESIEAPSMDALRKDHPEAYGKVKDLAGDGGPIRIGVVPRLPRFPDAPRLGRLFRQADEKPVLGVTVSEVPAVLRTQLSLRADEGIVVEEVKEGTTAARLGLRHHDCILSVNGIPVSSAEDCRASVGAVKEGGDLRLRVLRGGKVEELSGTR